MNTADQLATRHLMNDFDRDAEAQQAVTFYKDAVAKVGFEAVRKMFAQHGVTVTPHAPSVFRSMRDWDRAKQTTADEE